VSEEQLQSCRERGRYHEVCIDCIACRSRGGVIGGLRYSGTGACPDNRQPARGTRNECCDSRENSWRQQRRGHYLHGRVVPRLFSGKERLRNRNEPRQRCGEQFASRLTAGCASSGLCWATGRLTAGRASMRLDPHAVRSLGYKSQGKGDHHGSERTNGFERGYRVLVSIEELFERRHSAIASGKIYPGGFSPPHSRYAIIRPARMRRHLARAAFRADEAAMLGDVDGI
jgi:hypothetical protein